VKAHAVASLKADHPLGVLLEVAGLARSTYFYHQARLERPDPRAELKAAVRDAFEQAHGRYGHRRVHAVLAREGWRVAKKTVLALMRALGLACRVRRKRRYSSWRGEVGQIAPNTLDRDFTASGPNQKWVTDVTEFRVGSRKVYLSPVIDLFDRSVVAHSSALSPSLELTNGSLEKALATRSPDQTPLVHSDQGFQYQHPSWRRLLRSANATQSMSRKATCLDNAVAENFFGHLKEELFHHNSFASTDELTTAIDEYIHWWNTERISTKLKGLSPAQYRAQALEALGSH
jgi:putative transposase